MKTLIVYASTYGFAEECAKTLAEKAGADLVNIQKNEPQSLDRYDAVVVGGSIYMGRVQKKLKDYVDGHAAELMAKKLALFLCCGLPENVEQAFAANFPPELLAHAVARETFGGRLDKSRLSFGHKLIAGMMENVAKKEGKPLPAPLPGNIEKMAAAII